MLRLQDVSLSLPSSIADLIATRKIELATGLPIVHNMSQSLGTILPVTVGGRALSCSQHSDLV